MDIRDKIIELVKGGGMITNIADDILALEVDGKEVQECADISKCTEPKYCQISQECGIIADGYPCPHYKSRPATIKDLTRA